MTWDIASLIAASVMLVVAAIATLGGVRLLDRGIRRRSLRTALFGARLFLFGVWLLGKPWSIMCMGFATIHYLEGDPFEVAYYVFLAWLMWPKDNDWRKKWRRKASEKVAEIRGRLVVVPVATDPA